MNTFVSLSEETANKLLHMIVIEKIFPPGSRLPSETDLSKILSVSRTSLREAVKILISNNVLEIKRGVGTFVTISPSVSAGTFWDTNLEDCYKENKHIALEALKIRLLIEPSMIKSSVLNATEKEKQLIYKYEEKCRTLILEKKDYTFEDHLFHKSIAAASHNSTYKKLIPVLHTSIAIILRSKDFKATAKMSADNALIHHQKMAEAIRDGDITGAELATKTHLHTSIKILDRYM